jgi:soluble lytic murein transglycosylase-like protein
VLRPLLVAASILASSLGAVARADMYTFTDKDGVIHFTNIKPRGKDRRPWKTLFKTAPSGKGAAIRGSCERCDRVPASDRSADRYTRYDAHILEAAELYQIPEALIRAIIKVESDYDPRVVSAVGAMGLMQLMPANVEEDRVGPDPFEPRANILGGARQLRRLANRYDGDLIVTLAAYSAGQGAVAKYGNTLPPYETTQRYVRMVLAEYERQKVKLAKAR